MSIHYVAQELPLAELNEQVKPVDMVLRADVERVLLLEDLKVRPLEAVLLQRGPFNT